MPELSVMALSGGMDSTGLLMHLLSEGHEVHALSYDYGQKHSIEIERAKANISYEQLDLFAKHDESVCLECMV